MRKMLMKKRIAEDTTMSHFKEKLHVRLKNMAILTGFKSVLTGCVDPDTDELIPGFETPQTEEETAARSLSYAQNVSRNQRLREELKNLKQVYGIHYYGIKGAYFEQSVEQPNNNHNEINEGLIGFENQVYENLEEALQFENFYQRETLKPFDKPYIREKINEIMNDLFERGAYSEFKDDEMAKNSVIRNIMKKIEKNVMASRRKVSRKYFNEESFLLVNENNINPSKFYEIAIKLGKKYCQETVLLIFPPTSSVGFPRGILYGTNATQGVGSIIYLGRLKYEPETYMSGIKRRPFTFVMDEIAEQHPIHSIEQGIQ